MTAAAAATGDLDPGFSGDGLATTVSGARNAAASVLQADGKLVVAGTGAFADGSVSMTGTWVARYTTTGALDTSFGPGGIAKVDAGSGFEAVRDVVLDATGRALVAGYVTAPDSPDDSDDYVLRLTAAGARDTTLGGGDGVATFDLGNHDRAGGIAVSASRILVGVSQDDAGNWANKWTVLAVTATGALDKTFSGDGKAEFPTTKLSTFDALRGIAVQKDAKIVLGGTSGTSFAAARLSSSGSLDATWDGDGIATATVENGGAASALVVQPDGKVVLAGYWTRSGRADKDFSAVRWTGTGALDTRSAGTAAPRERRP